MSDREYCYPPDYTVLKNKLGLRDAGELEHFEREFVMQRIAQGTPSGNFDLAHLKAIHRHLFQDVYEWAGKIRTVEIAKGGSGFQLRRFVETGVADIHRRLVAGNFLKDLDADTFAREAGQIIGDVNHAHPFREGNGRTQLIYLEQLARQAGHPLNLTRLDRDRWTEASREAHFGRYEAIGACIARAIGINRERERERGSRDR